MLGNDRSVTRFAGQVGDITQFMPKSGPQYEKQAIEAMNANNVRRIGGIKSDWDQSIAGIKGVTTAQLGNLKGQMMITQGNLNATKILTGAEANAAATKAQGDANQFSGMMSGLSGLVSGGLGFAKNAGMFGGTGTMDNPFGADKDAGTAGYIDFGTGSGVNYANENGKLLW